MLEPTLLRPLYRRAEEYQLLITFGLLLILEDLMRLIWGPYPLSVSALYEAHGSLTAGDPSIPPTISPSSRWARSPPPGSGPSSTAPIRRGASRHLAEHAHGLRAGVNVNRVYVQAFTLGCFMAGLAGAIVVPQQGAVLGMGVDALILAFVVVVIGGLGSLEGALVGALLVGFVREAGITFFPEIELAVLYLMAAVVLLVRPAGLFGRA